MSHLFRFLEPTFFAGLIDDPCLVVRDRPVHQSVMFDCGTLHHLAKREMKPIRAIFVSHAHMDHFMGFDAFLRQIHASPRRVELFGPPGMADRVAARLAGYDWNLAEPYWCTFFVHEIHQEKTLTVRFSGPERFKRYPTTSTPRTGEVIYRYNHLEVSAILLSHDIPVLAFRLKEKKIFSIDKNRMASLGLLPKDWLTKLKKQFFDDWPPSEPLTAQSINDGIKEEITVDAKELYHRICGTPETNSLGYLTDWGYTHENRRKVLEFFSGTTFLVGECAFLKNETHKARSSHHLCTDDWNELLAELRPRYFLPMHLSKTYQGRSPELYQELQPTAGTTILSLPEHLTPPPIHAHEARFSS